MLFGVGGVGTTNRCDSTVWEGEMRWGKAGSAAPVTSTQHRISKAASIKMSASASAGAPAATRSQFTSAAANRDAALAGDRQAQYHAAPPKGWLKGGVGGGEGRRRGWLKQLTEKRQCQANTQHTAHSANPKHSTQLRAATPSTAHSSEQQPQA